MKKVLLTSTALILSAGIAAAEVTVGGDGRMGIIDRDDAAGLQFTSRIRISFAASGETDGGLTFGGSIRADNAGASATGATSATVLVNDAAGRTPGSALYVPTFLTTTSVTNGGGGVNGFAGNVFVSGAFGKLSMGDVSGAAEKAVGDLSGVGLTGLGGLNEATYLLNNTGRGSLRPNALYEYSFGDVTLYASAETPAFSNAGYGIGAKYSPGTYTVAIGYESVDFGGAIGTLDHVIIGGSANFAGATIKALYGNLENAFDDQYGLSADYTFGATTVTAFAINQFDGEVDYGLGGSYDLGGGAALKGGVVRNNFPGGGDTTAFDFGMSMSF